MSHTINLYVIRKDTMKQANILDGVPHVEEHGYFLVPLGDELIGKLKIDYMEDGYQHKAEQLLLRICPDMAWVETDYFGGCGEQSAKAWVNRIPYSVKRDGDVLDKDMSINEALKSIGVVRSEKNDEFDIIRLGRYRSNHDVIHEWEEITGKTIEKTVRRLLLKQIPKEMNLYLSEERVYISVNEYVSAVGLAKAADHPKKYYRCVITKNDVIFSDVATILNTKETRTRVTEAEFAQALPHAISHVNVDYWVDTIYTFMKYTAIVIGVNDVTTLCAVEYECDNLGVAVLHDQVKAQALMYDENFTCGPYNIGRNERKEVFKPVEKKPTLIRKTVEVYECPDCKQGTLVELNGTHCCNVCNYKIDLTEA